MTEVAASVWQGEWDASSMPPGPHEILVVATTPSGMEAHAIRVDTAITECDDGVDNDDNGFIDHPHDGGCTSPSDDAEEGWAPGDDDDDSAADDDDTAPPDDDSAHAPDGTAGGCACAQAGEEIPSGAVVSMLGLARYASRRTRRS